MNDIISKIDKYALREFLCKGWMTHDAMWLYHCLEEFGVEKMNKINLAAVQSMAAIEIQRIKKIFGLPGDHAVKTFDELFKIMEGAMGLVKGDFMKFQFSRSSKNILHWAWEEDQCFAFAGVSQLGIGGQYQCGILKRIEGWLHGLGATFVIVPEIEGCLMHTQGTCAGNFILDLE